LLVAASVVGSLRREIDPQSKRGSRENLQAALFQGLCLVPDPDKVYAIKIKKVLENCLRSISDWRNKRVESGVMRIYLAQKLCNM
jgi:hypothetical protein